MPKEDDQVVRNLFYNVVAGLPFRLPSQIPPHRCTNALLVRTLPNVFNRTALAIKNNINGKAEVSIGQRLKLGLRRKHDFQDRHASSQRDR